MTSNTVPGPRSGKTGPRQGAARLTLMLAAGSMPDSGLDISVCASEAERAALAQDYGLVALQTLVADFHVQKLDRARYKVSGTLQARVTRTCVVSLDPFETHLRADIEVDFA